MSRILSAGNLLALAMKLGELARIVWLFARTHTHTHTHTHTQSLVIPAVSQQRQQKVIRGKYLPKNL